MRAINKKNMLTKKEIDNQELNELISEAKMAAIKLRVISKEEMYSRAFLFIYLLFFIGLGAFCISYIYSNSSYLLSSLSEKDAVSSIIATFLFLGTVISILGIRHSFLQFIQYKYRQDTAQYLLSEFDSMSEQIDRNYY